MKDVVEEWVNRYADPHDYKDVTSWTFDVKAVEATIREREADAMKEMSLTDDEQHKLIGIVTRCARLRHVQYSAECWRETYMNDNEGDYDMDTVCEIRAAINEEAFIGRAVDALLQADSAFI